MKPTASQITLTKIAADRAGVRPRLSDKEAAKVAAEILETVSKEADFAKAADGRFTQTK